jgi:hypothetical protein
VRHRVVIVRRQSIQGQLAAQLGDQIMDRVQSAVTGEIGLAGQLRLLDPQRSGDRGHQRRRRRLGALLDLAQQGHRDVRAVGELGLGQAPQLPFGGNPSADVFVSLHRFPRPCGGSGVVVPSYG